MEEPVAINKLAILAAILRRNAVRRQAQLPLLDVRALYRRETAYARSWALHVAHYPALHAEVVKRLTVERGPEFIRTRFAAWMAHTEATRLMRERF